MAHIIAASPQGPRAEAAVAESDRGSYNNLILLCANCHTTIDKAPEDFPAELVRRWKDAGIARIEALFAAVEQPDRESARAAIELALAENRAVFQQYGPNNEYRHDPESELASVWQRKMLSTVLPNNRRILAVLDANRSHLTANEVATLEAFRQHVDDLEAKHVGEPRGDVSSRFPDAMNHILREGEDG